MLAGVLDPAGIKFLEEQLEAALEQGAEGLDIDMTRLESISPEAMCFLIFRKQKLGAQFPIRTSGASGSVLAMLQMSEFTDEATLV